MTLLRLELETFGFDTMLGSMHQLDEPKRALQGVDDGSLLRAHHIFSLE